MQGGGVAMPTKELLLSAYAVSPLGGTVEGAPSPPKLLHASEGGSAVAYLSFPSLMR